MTPIIICGATASRPGSQYEEHRLPGHPRALGFYAQTKSPGRICALLVQVLFSRRQAVGGATSANRTLTAVTNFCGSLSRWSNALLYVCQDAKRGLSKLFPVPFFVLAHDEKHEREVLKCPTRVL